MSNKEEAKSIINFVGGKENIAALTHCVTRLRFALRDDTKVDKAGLENLEDVKGTSMLMDSFKLLSVLK
ncbi:PTS transporter subunit EIIB [Enterococcus faecium]|uniref:PTS transporter subunit EIIB n=1 Tax=Enterococcus faecium TaxID=1352 RepID=UPI001D080D4A|nr:PTS transporter subunit EIIB [Enterococcus faecium]